MPPLRSLKLVSRVSSCCFVAGLSFPAKSLTIPWGCGYSGAARQVGEKMKRADKASASSHADLGVNNEDVKHEDVKYEDVKYEDVKYEDVKYEDVKYEDVSNE